MSERGVLAAVAAAQAREEMLILIGKRHRNSDMVIRRTGWHPRSVMRYAKRLEEDGLITRTRDHDLLEPWKYRWVYALTENGKRAIAGP